MKPALVFIFCLWVAALAGAEPTYQIDRALVTVERRHGQPWCVLDAQVTAEVPLGADRLLAVITDWQAYPRLFPKIRRVTVEPSGTSVLLTENLVIEALGLTVVNNYTLRLTPLAPPAVGWSWVQSTGDGSTEDVSGEWVLVPSTSGATTKVIYRSKSAVPLRIFGQDTVLRLALGNETRAIVETVVKQANSR